MKAADKEIPLTSSTRKRIFGALKRWGVDDEMRRIIQRDIVGKESLKDFSESDGRFLLSHLQQGLKQPRPARQKNIRQKYTRPDGIVQIHVRPDASQKKIRFAYFLMKQIIEEEKKLFAVGDSPDSTASPGSARKSGTVPKKPENWSDNAGRRLDGWSEELTNGEADRISLLMQEEIDRLIIQLRNRKTWLQRKVNKSTTD